MLRRDKVKRIVYLLIRGSGFLLGGSTVFIQICKLSEECRAKGTSRAPLPLTLDDYYNAIISIIIGLAFIINFFLPFLRYKIKESSFKYLNILVFIIISFALLKWSKSIIEAHYLEALTIVLILPLILILIVFSNWLLLCKEVFKKK